MAKSKVAKGGKKRAAEGKPQARGTKKPRNADVSDQEDDRTAAAIEGAVNRDLRQLRMAQQEALEAPAADESAAESGAEAKQDGNEPAADAADAEEAKPDPYLLADASYIQKDTRWRNKQRTLVFASRGVTSRNRHLCEDIRKLLPHHKTEPKFDKKASLHEINEVCELKSCNNVIYFESRKGSDLYMYVGRVPQGPTMKFQVLNVHTTSEVRLAGNCLLGSRPLLYFDKAFSELAELKLVKTLFTQAFGTPRNHPKSKPFHDHIMSFYWMDGKIWFRHYQISAETASDENDPDRQQLTEIGPRFVLDPIRILNGSFSGSSLFANANYMSPTALRSHAKKLLKSPYEKRLHDKADRKARVEAGILPEDPTDEAFV